MRFIHNYYCNTDCRYVILMWACYCYKCCIYETEEKT